MNKDVFQELHDQVLKTCRLYGISIVPGMSYMEMWEELVKEFDTSTRKILKNRLKKDILDGKGVVFEDMLQVLEKQEKKHQSGKSKDVMFVSEGQTI
ncbi:hypothetical protein [Sediminibacillus massiliensis]|uniref:hypothetical protein n=1 Tax=Sediminibacillus massiliensis TaxID=1926277 RepID=UPI0009884D73|nr:hypothetical protein [Sediminibacillus massiliensis]